jgi:hypothetical protein
MLIDHKEINSTNIVLEQTAEDIKNLIKTIRDRQVLLDRDVARLYGYESKRINETANRNNNRFPEQFRFQLTTAEEEDILKSQIATSSGPSFISQSTISSSVQNAKHGGRRKPPFAYTEQGIGMLSGLLRSDTVAQVSIGIMNAFVEIRQFISSNQDVFANIANINRRLLEHDNKFLEQGTNFNEILDLLNATETPKQSVFYNGQFYDAFKFAIEIIKNAKNNITVIDNYIDDSVLDMLAKKAVGVSVVIITSNPNRLSKLHTKKFSSQYGHVQVVKCKNFHDRFILLDHKEVYVFGASIKDLGNKCFGIWKMEDTTTQFITKVDKITSIP